MASRPRERRRRLPDTGDHKAGDHKGRPYARGVPTCSDQRRMGRACPVPLSGQPGAGDHKGRPYARGVPMCREQRRRGRACPVPLSGPPASLARATARPSGALGSPPALNLVASSSTRELSYTPRKYIRVK